MSNFCKIHKSFYGSSGCPDCNRNRDERPYRGMNTPVMIDTGVVRVKPPRKDLVYQALQKKDERP